MNAKPAQARKLFSTRRKALLGLVAIALAVVGWLQYIGAAGISGIGTKDMDWNGDGKVSQQEIFESFHAVAVKKTSEGQRECSSYYWRKDRSSIRVECRTVMAPAAGKQE
jgi:hypothetical protein